MDIKERLDSVFAGPSLDALDSESVLKLEAVLENYPKDKDVCKLVGFANMDATDDENIPSGLLAIHPVDAKVHPDSIPDSTFDYIVVCPILPKKNHTYTDADFPINAALHEAAPQYSETPALLRRNKDGDAKSWSAEIGDTGSAGVYKKIRDNGRGADYFIVAKAGAPVACAELKEYLADKSLTFEEALNDPKVSYTRYLAQRNAKRLAYNVARAYKVPIRHTADVGAYTGEEHIATPKRAEAPTGFMQAQSSITSMPRGYDGISSVGIFHDVRPVEDASDVCFVTASPYDGIALFQIKGNAVGFGLPASTGRTPASELQKMAPIADSVYQQRSQGITWEKKDRNGLQNHPDLHPNAFRPIDDKFLQTMRDLGWKQTGTNNREYFLPVAVKIANPEMRRNQ